MPDYNIDKKTNSHRQKNGKSKNFISQNSEKKQNARSGGKNRTGKKQNHGTGKYLKKNERVKKNRDTPDEVQNENIGYWKMPQEQLYYLRSVKLNDEDVDLELPETNLLDNMELRDIAGVKIHKTGSVISFDCNNNFYNAGDDVIVETGTGLFCGKVVSTTQRQMVKNKKISRILRKSTKGDDRQKERNEGKQSAAFRLCRDRIFKLNLPMKLIDVEYLHSGNKAVFYFCSDGRVDFRDLVRDLAGRLHTRIEMRQIGIRDGTRMIGGLGDCGCTLCCTRYIREFVPVSIRMAKNQNLVLNPQKVSGVCGRLLCCLSYENETYVKEAKKLPKAGSFVKTPDGNGKILEVNVLKKDIKVIIEGEKTPRTFPSDDVSLLNKKDSLEKNVPENPVR